MDEVFRQARADDALDAAFGIGTRPLHRNSATAQSARLHALAVTDGYRVDWDEEDSF